MVYDGIIEGLTVRLRSIEERDAEATFRMRSDKEKSRFVHSAKGTVDDQLAFIRNQRKKEGDYLFVIEDLCGKLIGMKGVYGYDPVENVVETGRFMNFGSQVQGTEALYLSFDFAFDVLGVDKIIMSALENNVNMRGMQDKFGVVITHRVFDPEFGCDSVYSELTREAYGKSRPRVSALVERFAKRIGDDHESR